MLSSEGPWAWEGEWDLDGQRGQEREALVPGTGRVGAVAEVRMDRRACGDVSRGPWRRRAWKCRLGAR